MRSALLLFMLPTVLLGCPKKPDPVEIVEEVDPYPALVCPEGTEKKGKPPPEGMKVWCMRFTPAGQWINEGGYIEFHETGEKKLEGSWANNRREGTFKTFYMSGQIETEEIYYEGKAEGIWIEYHENGQKRAEGEKANGKETGPWLYWHDNGNKWKEGVWKNGEPDGTWLEFDPDGTPKIERLYKFGRLLTQKVLNAE